MKIPKVGFGTWRIGGGETADKRQDAKSLAALRSALELGYTHFNTTELYAGGHCEELLGLAIQELRMERGSLFITSKVKPENLTATRVLSACEASLKRLETEYLDLYLIHWPNRSIRQDETFEGLNRLARQGKICHVGVSNFELPLLKQAQSQFERPLLTNQVPMSLFERGYARNVVLEYCQANTGSDHCVFTSEAPAHPPR